MNQQASESISKSNRHPPEKVTLVYETREDGAVHVFRLLEVPGLIVLDHDLARAYAAGVRGASELISDACGEPVEYEVGLTFAEFKQKVERQAGTLNTTNIVPVECEIHKTKEAA